MPRIKISEIISFSSEDPNHPAENLLSNETFRKWKIASSEVGKQATVIVRLEKLTSIRSVDIGNEGSAFVELLVSRDEKNYEVLLAASSFMSPVESRNLKELNRVRMFGPEKLTKLTLDQKWSYVKIVCSQPFNKQQQFGLAFITINAPDTVKSSSDSSVSSQLLGGVLRMTEDEPSDSICSGYLFARRKESTPHATTSMRNAVATATSENKCATPKRKNPDESLGFYQLKKQVSSGLENTGSEMRCKKASNVANEASESSTKKEANQILPTTLTNNKTDETHRKVKYKEASSKNYNKECHDKRLTEISNRAHHSDLSGGSRKHAPFHYLMKGVVFVLSGYVNPQRSELRQRMTAMGAKYRADWDLSCTHLICAFANTPKYNAVRGQGKIVSHQWVNDCFTLKKKIPWRRHRLDKSEPSDESEEEVWAEELRPSAASHEGGNCSSGEDTDDDIRRAQSKNECESAHCKKGSDQSPASCHPDSDAFEDDTDTEEAVQTVQEELPVLPDYFNGKVFFIYGQPKNENAIKRYIIAFGGSVSNYMAECVEYVVTEKQWDAEFDEALASNSLLRFVSPMWVWRCSDEERLLDWRDFAVQRSNQSTQAKHLRT